MGSLSVRNLSRRPLRAPAFPFIRASKRILPRWDISLAFIGEAEARKLNRSLRKKNYVPNVLSYETGPRSGEVLICLPVAKRQAPEYGMTYTRFVGFLFIHALLHLEGKRHGPTMDKSERAWLARIAPDTRTNEKTHRNRNRHRNLAGKGRRH